MSRRKNEYVIFNAHIKRVVLLGLLMCCALTAAAQQYRFDCWTTGNGLPQASVKSILQTRDGYLWLSKFGGLVRSEGLKTGRFHTCRRKFPSNSRRRFI